MFEQTGPALIVQANQPRIYHYCCYYYWRAGGIIPVQLEGVFSSLAQRSAIIVQPGVITASLQANARKFGERGCCLKCFMVWLSHGHYVSRSVCRVFTESAFVGTGGFLQCDKAFK